MNIRVDTRQCIDIKNFKCVNPSFRGELETKFFNAIRKGNKKESIKLLNNIKFDIFEKDSINGNNFLHIVCIEGTQEFFNKALKLLRINKEKIQQVLAMVNKENKKPFDYLKDDNFRNTINSLIGAEKVDGATEAIIATGVVAGATASTDSDEENQKVGNEITEKIDLDEFSFDEEDDVEPILTPKAVQASGINAIVGQDNLKQILEKEIIRPIKNNKNVFSNGILLHGLSGSGKTFAIEKLAEELGKEVVYASTLLNKIDSINEQNNGKIQDNTSQIEKEVERLIDSSVIKINPDDMRELFAISDMLKDFYTKTNKQGMIFIDEIQKLFPSNKNVYNTRAIQTLENSSSKGMIVFATTQDLESVDETTLNSLRFEELVELKLPRKNEIIELINKNINVKLSSTEIEKLAKQLNGFSYSDIVRIIQKTQYHIETPNLNDFEKQIKDYADAHSIDGLTEEGTTSAYDTYLKRTTISDNGPKSLDDVMGMKDVKAKLKKVFGPVKKRSILDGFFRANKVKSPNGILLYGPPGCGKTYIMTALASDVGLPLYQVKLSDIGSSYINATEKNIKKVFDQLRKKYKETGEASILFFDECDTFFSKSLNSDNQAVLNTLKEEMNNAGDDGIYIVAATNEKDNLNTAIIRDGRFDTKIEVGYPDKEARIALIAKCLDRPALINNKVDKVISDLADLTSGLSNASITGLFSTITYEKGSLLSGEVDTLDEFNEKLKDSPIALQQIKDAISAKKEEINKMKLKSVDRTGLAWQAKTAAYDEFKERVYYSKDDPKSLSDVIGMDDIKRQLVLKVLAPLNPITKKLYEDENIPLGGGIVLHGPGGVGKTFIIRATAAESKIPLYEMKLSEEGSSFVNQTAKNIQQVFNQLKRKYKETGEPSILFLDECDSLLGKPSGSGNSSEERMGVINTLKQELAEAQKNGIVVLAATNNYHDLDPVVTRSGRFNNHIKIDYPDAKARKAYIIHLLSKRPSTKEIAESVENLKILGELSKGMSNADIKTAVEEAVLSSQEDFIKSSLTMVKDANAHELLDKKRKKVSFEEIKDAFSKKLEEVKNQRGEYEGT